MIFIFVLFMTLLGALGAFFFKKATKEISFKLMLQKRDIYIGGGCYFLSALINIFLLEHVSYSVLLPLTSITYIWTLLISKKYLNEKLTNKKVIGISLIILGTILFII